MSLRESGSNTSERRGGVGLVGGSIVFENIVQQLEYQLASFKRTFAQLCIEAWSNRTRKATLRFGLHIDRKIGTNTGRGHRANRRTARTSMSLRSACERCNAGIRVGRQSTNGWILG